MPETATTTTILVRFCVTIAIVGAAWTSGGLIPDFLRFAFFGVAFADIVFPGWRVRPFGGLTLTLSLSRFVLDLQPPSHARGAESLMGLVNQS